MSCKICQFEEGHSQSCPRYKKIKFTIKANSLEEFKEKITSIEKFYAK